MKKRAISLLIVLPLIVGNVFSFGSHDQKDSLYYVYGIDLQASESEILSGLRERYPDLYSATYSTTRETLAGPGDQNISEGINLDFAIDFFENEFRGMSLFNKNDDYFHYLLDNPELTKPDEFLNAAGLQTYRWETKDGKMSYKATFNQKTSTWYYLIRNEEVWSRYNEFLKEKHKDDPFF